jgi:cell division septation protein DedD
MLESRELVQHVQDDAFHEIQLNGKQLVFLFMVATVVSVAIFLCGVFVGRGVRTERAATVADAGGVTPVATPDVVRSEDAAPVPAGSDPTAAAPPPAVDELSYFNRLEKPGRPEEKLSPAGKAGETPPAAAPTPPARGQAPLVEQPPADARLAEPAGAGFALQITALRERGEAESIAKRLSAKGYAAYVLTPEGGAPSVYRVRIGKFKTRREAETIATKLQREEQFTPWITR